MTKFIKVSFEFEDTPLARQHLAHALQDESWLNKSVHPELHIGLGMIELEALFIVSKALGEHGAVAIQEMVKPLPIKVVSKDVGVKHEASVKVSAVASKIQEKK